MFLYCIFDYFFLNIIISNVARFLRLTLLQSRDRFRSNIMNLKYYNSIGSSNFQFLDDGTDSNLESSRDITITNIEKISFEPNLYYKIINKVTQWV